VIVLGSPAPRALFYAGDASAIQAGRSLGQWWPEGDGSLIATVVPDGVSRVMYIFGAGHHELRMTVETTSRSCGLPLERSLRVRRGTGPMGASSVASLFPRRRAHGDPDRSAPQQRALSAHEARKAP
jgi:hypothetical protein